MKEKAIFLLIVVSLLFAACAPQTDSLLPPGEGPGMRETAAPRPTATPAPTPTPVAVDGIAAVDGTLYLFDETAQAWTALPELDADFARVMVTEDGRIVAVDANGAEVYALDMATGEWVEVKITYTPEELAEMSGDEKLAAAPEEAGYTKAMSGVKDHLVKYYGEDSTLEKVYNLLEGQWQTPQEAGIIEFVMKDGQLLEMAWFETVQEAIDYLYLERGAHGSTRDQMQHVDAISKAQKMNGINGGNFPDDLGRQYISGYEVLYDKNDRNKIAFGVSVVKIMDGCYISTFTKDSIFEQVYINQDANEVANLIGRGLVTAPLPDGQ